MSSGKMVRLDVGGALFTTTRQTLTKYDGFFKKMLDSEFLDTDQNGNVFVDRSPKHFELVLNFLRDGQTPVPSDPFDREQLLQEAKFYMLDGLIYICGGDPSPQWKRETFKNDFRLTKNMDEFYEFERNFNHAYGVTIHYDSQRLGDISDNINVIDFVAKHSGKWKILFYNRITAVDFIHINLPKKERWKFVCIGTTLDITHALQQIDKCLET